MNFQPKTDQKSITVATDTAQRNKEEIQRLINYIQRDLEPFIKTQAERINYLESKIAQLKQGPKINLDMGDSDSE